MKRIKFIYLFISIVLNINFAPATEYYFSNSGDDTNNGISPVYPLKSISKLNSLMFKLKPGDAVLFERGGVYYGQININASGNENAPILFGAYGSGRNPVISGSVPVNNWKVHKGNIYKAYVKSKVKDLFVYGERMILARYPNTGFLRVDKPFPNDRKGFFDKNLGQSEGYWDSSIVRIRTENWAYEHSVVQKFRNGNITLSDSTLYSVKQNWGYYLDNNFAQLDMEKEWYYNNREKNSENLYLYAPNGQDPNTLNVQATVSDCGFFSVIELTNIIIRDLEFQNQNSGGIYLAKKKSKVFIENCTFIGQNLYGIVIPSGSDNININNCRFYDINGYAIYILNTKNTSATNSIFENIGMIPGYGTTKDAFSMSGVLIFGNNINISGNNINLIGHNGINCIGNENVIEKNIVKNTLMLLNDGGAIKCYGEQSKNSYWNNNFIFNVPGNLESTDGLNKIIIGLGIYLDELANNMNISGNTIQGSGSAGIGTNAGFNNLIIDNICYDNAIAATFYQNKIPCKNNNFKNNILFSVHEDQVTILNQSYQSINVPGIFNENIYFNPGNYNVFRILHQNVITDYNFDKWKQFVGSDDNSKMIVSKKNMASKLFCNMSDDTISVILNAGTDFKDLNMNGVYGSITLPPWRSEILMANSEVKDYPEINIAGGKLNFEKIERNAKSPLWFNLICFNLKENVRITAPEGFLISTDDDEEYRNSITLYPGKGDIDRIIFVKFDPDENKKYYDFINVESGNVKSKIKVAGTSG